MDIKNGNLIEDNPTVEKPQRSNKVYFFIIAILALLATNAYYAIRYKNLGKQVEVLSSEKSQLEIEVDRIEAELTRITNENIDKAASFKREHDEAKAMIDDLRKKLSESPTIDQADLLKTQQEIRKLRDLVSQYRVDIENLQKEKLQLTKERDNLQTSVKSISEQADRLQEEKIELEKKIEDASDLKISQINITALKVKSSKQESVENKAKKIDKFHINFTLSNNTLAKAEQYNIYLRITEPSGNLLTEGNVFKINNEEIQYTSASSIVFNNDGEEYSIDWEPKNYDFQKGTYTIILYTEQSIMGRSTISLK